MSTRSNIVSAERPTGQGLWRVTFEKPDGSRYHGDLTDADLRLHQMTDDMIARYHIPPTILEELLDACRTLQREEDDD